MSLLNKFVYSILGLITSKFSRVFPAKSSTSSASRSTSQTV